MQISGELFSDPKVYVQAFNWKNGTASCHDMVREDYVRTSFLDDRTQSSVGPYNVDLQSVADHFEAVSPARKRANFIFHIAFGGSTLLSRCLDEEGVCLAYKEPFLLHQLAFRMRPEWAVKDDREDAQIMELTLALLARTYDEKEIPLIKPSDSGTNLARPLLQYHSESRALLLYSQLEAFAVSMLKHPDRRMYLRNTIPRARADLKAHGVHQIDTDGLSDAQAAGLVWLSQFVQFLDLLADPTLPVRSLDSARFYKSPLKVLKTLADFFDLSYAPEYLEREVTHGSLQQDSKNTDRNYDSAAEAKRKKAQREELKPEVEEAKRWVSKYSAVPTDGVRLPRDLLGPG